MIRYLILSLVLYATVAPTVGAQQETLLWPPEHAANQGKGTAHDEGNPQRLVVHYRPSMLAYPLKGETPCPAVMICPGGAYGRLALEHEGTQAAQWFNERGIAAFILKYRCGGGKNVHPAPLDDALQGMRLIRSRAKEWNIEPAKVGVIGFSAGGHLASSVSTLATDGDPSSDEAIVQQSSWPDFSILVYPVITMDASVTHGGSRRNLLGNSPDAALAAKLSTEQQVTKQTPPTLLIHASDDRAVPVENALRYYQSLTQRRIPAEMHIYEQGGHGFGMLTKGTASDQWLAALESWLTARGLISSSR